MSISLFINEPSLGLTDRTSFLNNHGSGNSFRLQQGNRHTATFWFYVAAPNSYAPTLGTPIYLYEIVSGVSTCAYCGTIDDIAREWIGNTGARWYEIRCVSFEQMLDTLIISPPRVYASQTCGAILQDIVTNCCAGIPVTLGAISTGPLVSSLVFDHTRVTDALNQLATIAGFVWGVDIPTQTIYSYESNTNASAITVDPTKVLWQTAKLNSGRQNYRNNQSLRISFNAFTAAAGYFAGDGATTVFYLPNSAKSLLTAVTTTGVRAARVGTFTGQPSANDTITVNDLVYKFVAALDNTQFGQVLIAGSLASTIQNLADAINANDSTRGVGYSTPTWENDACYADTITGTQLTARTKVKGTSQNAFPLTKSCANFSWAGSPTTGGTDGADTTLKIAVSGTGQTGDIYWSPTSGAAVASAVLNVGSTSTNDTVTVGSTTYTLLTNSYASVFLLCQHSPNTLVAGDTVVIGAVTYTVVSSLNNAVPNQILGTVPTMARAFKVAINADSGDGYWGVYVSSATVANPTWSAGSVIVVPSGFFTPGGGAGQAYDYIQISARVVGTANNGITFTINVHGGGVWLYSCSAPALFTSCGATTAATSGGAGGFTAANQVSRGTGSAGSAAQCVIDAINGEPSTVGTNYSSGTIANASATAATTATPGEVQAIARTFGTGGNSIGVSASLSGGAHWKDTSGGANTSHLVGGANASGAVVTCATAPGNTVFLQITYQRLGGDVITCENTSLVTARAAIEHSTGRYAVIASDTSIIDPALGLQQVQKSLAAYQNLVSVVQIQSDTPNVSVGQYVTIALTSPCPASMQSALNGGWIVNQIDAKLLDGMANPNVPAPGGHFRYTITFVSAQILNYLLFWQNLAPAR